MFDKYYKVKLYKDNVFEKNKRGVGILYSDVRDGDIQDVIIKKGLLSSKEIVTNIDIKERRDCKKILTPSDASSVYYIKTKDLNNFNLASLQDVIDYIDNFDSEKFMKMISEDIEKDEQKEIKKFLKTRKKVLKNKDKEG